MLGVIFILPAVRSVCAALVEFGVRPFGTAAVLGFAITVIAFYASLGLLLEAVKGIPLPMPMTFRKKEAQAALEGGSSAPSPTSASPGWCA